MNGNQLYWAGATMGLALGSIIFLGIVKIITVM